MAAATNALPPNTHRSHPRYPGLSLIIQQLKTWPKGDPRTPNCSCNQCPCSGSVLGALSITLAYFCRQLLVITNLCPVCLLTVSVWRDNLTDSYSLRSTYINDLSLSRSETVGEHLQPMYTKARPVSPKGKLQVTVIWLI